MLVAYVPRDVNNFYSDIEYWQAIASATKQNGEPTKINISNTTNWDNALNKNLLLLQIPRCDCSFRFTSTFNTLFDLSIFLPKINCFNTQNLEYMEYNIPKFTQIEYNIQF